MPKLFTVEIQGMQESESRHSGRSSSYQLIAETAADALIAALRRYSAADRNNDDIRYVNLSQNMNEVIEVEGRIDLRNVEFLSEIPTPTPPIESEEPTVASDGHGF